MTRWLQCLGTIALFVMSCSTIDTPRAPLGVAGASGRAGTTPEGGASADSSDGGSSDDNPSDAGSQSAGSESSSGGAVPAAAGGESGGRGGESGGRGGGRGGALAAGGDGAGGLGGGAGDAGKGGQGGEPNPPPIASATVTPEGGGTLLSADGRVRVVVPAGAVSSDLAISVQRTATA
ncbi:MAG: hypothetical protein ABW061_03290, partial [Polyangiaceae bacterium]